MRSQSVLFSNAVLVLALAAAVLVPIRRAQAQCAAHAESARPTCDESAPLDGDAEETPPSEKSATANPESDGDCTVDRIGDMPTPGHLHCVGRPSRFVGATQAGGEVPVPPPKCG